MYRKAIEVAPNGALVKYLQEDVARMLIDDPEELNIVLNAMNESTEEPEAETHEMPDGTIMPGASHGDLPEA